MLQKDKLRKADIFSGGGISIFGLWVMSRALQMPMKDSYGGVMNVWYVSPALFPLFIGAVLVLLGLSLIRIALKEVGSKQLAAVLTWLSGPEFLVYLKTPSVIRFYAMMVLFLSFIFLNIPRIDFFLCSVLFLMAFISMFYFDDDGVLFKILLFYLAGTGFFIIYFVLRLPDLLVPVLPYPSDWLALSFLSAICIYIWVLVRNTPALRKKYRTSLILAVAAPFIIGPIFKYFLLVPMPYEGLVVTVMDAIWYWDF